MIKIVSTSNIPIKSDLRKALSQVGFYLCRFCIILYISCIIWRQVLAFSRWIVIFRFWLVFLLAFLWFLMSAKYIFIVIFTGQSQVIVLAFSLKLICSCLLIMNSLSIFYGKLKRNQLGNVVNSQFPKWILLVKMMWLIKIDWRLYWKYFFLMKM